MGGDTIVQAGAADNPANVKTTWELNVERLFNFPTLGFTRNIFPRVNKNQPLIARFPGPILNVLKAGHDQPGPRLPNRNSFHIHSCIKFVLQLTNRQVGSFIR
jgi:hypothetical protein